MNKEMGVSQSDERKLDTILGILKLPESLPLSQAQADRSLLLVLCFKSKLSLLI